MMRTRAQRSAGLALSVAVLLALPACGTRLSDEQAVAQLSQAGQRAPADQQLGGAGVGTDEVLGIGGTTSTGGTTTADGTVPTTTSTGDSTAAGSTGGGGGGAGTSSGTTDGTGGTGGAGGTGGGGGGGGGSGTPAGAAKAPILVGVVGSFSGVLGSAFSPSRDAVSAWARTINGRGGIDGHQVKLLVGDDGSNAANDIAIVRRLVEQEGAIAILNFFPAAGGAPQVAKYAQEKGIPIVGGSSSEPEWTKFFNMFPATSSPAALQKGWAAAMKDSGAKRVGSVHCGESAQCADFQRAWAQAARALGLEVVYQGQVSLAQPDFTSACTAARSAGAEAVVTIVDGNSTLRYARDCARQQYKHTIIPVNPTNDVTPGMEGARAALGSFPWFLTSGSPAVEEYAAAVRKYKVKLAAFTSNGWTNGKMLEKALTGRVSNPPKTADVLEGLYSFRGETLGGLTQPLTFTKGKLSPPVPCAWAALGKGGKWAAPNALKATYCS